MSAHDTPVTRSPGADAVPRGDRQSTIEKTPQVPELQELVNALYRATERAGFEPAVPLRAHGISNAARSATPAPLRLPATIAAAHDSTRASPCRGGRTRPARRLDQPATTPKTHRKKKLIICSFFGLFQLDGPCVAAQHSRRFGSSEPERWCAWRSRMPRPHHRRTYSRQVLTDGQTGRRSLSNGQTDEVTDLDEAGGSKRN